MKTNVPKEKRINYSPRICLSTTQEEIKLKKTPVSKDENSLVKSKTASEKRLLNSEKNQSHIINSTNQFQKNIQKKSNLDQEIIRAASKEHHSSLKNIQLNYDKSLINRSKKLYNQKTYSNFCPNKPFYSSNIYDLFRDLEELYHLHSNKHK